MAHRPHLSIGLTSRDVGRSIGGRPYRSGRLRSGVASEEAKSFRIEQPGVPGLTRGQPTMDLAESVQDRGIGPGTGRVRRRSGGAASAVSVGASSVRVQRFAWLRTHKGKGLDEKWLLTWLVKRDD